jgi:hypothetical protein
MPYSYFLVGGAGLLRSLRAPSLPVGPVRSCEIYCPRIRDRISRYLSVATSASPYAFSFSIFFPFSFAVVRRLIVAALARSARYTVVPLSRTFVDPARGERSSGYCFRHRSVGRRRGPFVRKISRLSRCVTPRGSQATLRGGGSRRRPYPPVCLFVCLIQSGYSQ